MRLGLGSGSDHGLTEMSHLEFRRAQGQLLCATNERLGKVPHLAGTEPLNRLWLKLSEDNWES